MLYYLFQWLDKYDFPGAGMFGYTSFRSLMNLSPQILEMSNARMIAINERKDV